MKGVKFLVILKRESKGIINMDKIVVEEMYFYLQVFDEEVGESYVR